MYKKIALLLGCVGFCFITSCNLISSVGSSLLGPQSESDWSGSTASITYDGTQVQFELSNGVRTLNIQANQPVDVFMAKMNFGSKVLSARSTRYVASTHHFGTENQFSANLVENATYKNLPSDIDSLKDVSGITASGIIRKDFAPARDFVPPVLEKIGGASRGAEDVFSLQPVVGEPQKTVKSWNTGATKALWVDAPSKKGSAIESSSDGAYTKRNATLQAIGSYCYVWVVSNDGSGLTIHEDQAKTLANQFDEMYSKIREVFGFESDKIFHISGQKEMLQDITDVSDTGVMVNIVVYDIGGDYKVGQDSGVVGYFWPKDYYSKNSDCTYVDSANAAILALTNEGKYFYVDSGFLQNYESTVYSTLAHEFQHMINYGEKTVASKINATKQSDELNYSTWFTEMLSMVCEDMIQGYLNITDVDSSIGRLPTFAKYYYGSGLTDWLEGDNVVISYAGAYAFGAYLARNYGGTDLIKEIATNNYVDQQSITQALQSLGKNETFDSVFKKYVQALVLSNPPTTVNAPSFNHKVQGIGGDMKAIDLFEGSIVDKQGKEYSLCPRLLGVDANSRVDLRPYGFTLHRLGTFQSGNIQVDFSSPVNQDEKVYILVQPKK